MVRTVVVMLLVVTAGVGQASRPHTRYFSLGNCPNITEKYDFDPVPYLGRWYEQERFDVVFQAGMDCVNAIYSDLGDGYVEVHNTARTASGKYTDIVGKAHVIAPGVLLVEFHGHIPGEYHVLDTDYESFSAVYNCIQAGEYHFQYAWILSRTMTLDQTTLDYAHQVFLANGIDISLMHATYQGDDCPYTS
ncbi:apolipoprotein D-like [Panulirus ornatus]|uniref:apolipoprotein D-like n=1 Tax=Panulirus ornatus TaxID=150431 RepID=UPI003A88F280